MKDERFRHGKTEWKLIRLGKGGAHFRTIFFCFTGPPLVILEFVPHGDLLGYLRKSKGESDDYYNLRSKSAPRKIAKQQLYQFACDIARGMEFIANHKVCCF